MGKVTVCRVFSMANSHSSIWVSSTGGKEIGWGKTLGLNKIAAGDKTGEGIGWATSEKYKCYLMQTWFSAFCVTLERTAIQDLIRFLTYKDIKDVKLYESRLLQENSHKFQTYFDWCMLSIWLYLWIKHPKSAISFFVFLWMHKKCGKRSNFIVFD